MIDLGMQAVVQTAVLRAVAGTAGVRPEGILDECPGADERDLQRAIELLVADGCIDRSGSSAEAADPLTELTHLRLTAEGRSRLVAGA